MALLESLQGEYAVTLSTGSTFDAERLNRTYHTSVDASQIAVDRAPTPAWLSRLHGGDALRGAYLARHIRKIAPQFDLCISAYNFLPSALGRPGLHFIADFSWDDALRQDSDPPSSGIRGVVQRAGLLRRSYLLTCRAIAGDRGVPAVGQRDIVVANSRWTGDTLERRHGIASRLIYPPVHAEPFDPAASRTGDFVMLGRIDPDKRVDEAIDILARVRARGHMFKFHIMGPLDNSEYSERIKALARQHGHWVRLCGGVYGSEKFRELGRHTFALHMRKREAFGIAVAEQLKMGLIPFVPSGGAPAEIVCEPRLCFDNADHAVEIIDRVLQSSQDHSTIRASLAARAPLFAMERFVAEAGEVVREAMFETPRERL